MDSGFTIKSRPAVISRNHALRDPVTVREAAEADLDSTKIVTAVGDSGSKQDNGAHNEASAREVVLDPEGREALYSAIDVRAEHAAEQPPKEALMRLRAYQQHAPHRDLHADSSPDDTAISGSDPHADIEA
ncbi:MAG TPA: hypothetical protein VMH84_10235 [Xanthobacteraceae bacterium]|nr:hypothetical protein [Xanthobacteraceae bacterium]